MEEKVQIMEMEDVVLLRQGQRFPRGIDVARYADRLMDFGLVDSAPEEAVLAEFKKLLELLNLRQYKLYDADSQIFLQNIRSRVEFERLASHGPHLGKVSATYARLSLFDSLLAAHGLLSIISRSSPGVAYTWTKIF